MGVGSNNQCTPLPQYKSYGRLLIGSYNQSIVFTKHCLLSNYRGYVQLSTSGRLELVTKDYLR